MIDIHARALRAAALAAALAVAPAARAGQPLRQFPRQPVRRPAAASSRAAVPTRPSSSVRINQLESQIRQLTGTIEQLQFRNQQLEQQLRAQGGGACRRRQTCRRSAATAAPPRPQPPPPQAAPLPPPVAAAPAARARARTPRRRVRSVARIRARPARRARSAAVPAPVQSALPVRSASRRRSSWPSRRSACRADAIPASRSIFRRCRARCAGDPAQQGGMLPPPPARNPNATGAVASVAAAVEHPEGLLRPRLRLCAAQGLRLRRGRVSDFSEEISERQAGAGRAVLARRKPVPAPALRRGGGAVPRASRPRTARIPRRRTRCCGSARALRR